MTTGERMKARRKELGLSAEYVAERLGVSPATIYRYEKGDIEKMPGNILEPISRILNTTPSYLMGWDSSSVPDNILQMPSTYKVPRLGQIACGDPILAEENIEDYDNVPAYIKCDFTLVCRGDSMINARIFDGDIVFIKEMPIVENGDIAAVIIDNEATLKRFYYDKENNYLQLIAENPLYKPLVYRNEQLNEIRVLGKAVYFMSAL